MQLEKLDGPYPGKVWHVDGAGKKYHVTLFAPQNWTTIPDEDFISELDGILDPMIRFWMPGTIISSTCGNNKITALYPTNQYRKIVIEEV
jgi:hypothetical protein